MAEELDGRVEEIERSVETLESQMRAQIARTQFGTRVMLVVGIVAIVFSIIYMAIITSRIRKFIVPDELAGTVIAITQVRTRVQDLMSMVEQDLIDKAPRHVAALRDKAIPQVPDLISKGEELLVDQAPEYVAKLLDEAIEQMPALRERAETGVLDAVDVFAAQLDAEADEKIGEILSMRKATLEPLIEAASVEGSSEALEEAFRESLEELIGSDLDELMRKFDGAMAALDIRLARLVNPTDMLTPEEHLVKQLITHVLIYIDEAIKEQGAPTPPAP